MTTFVGGPADGQTIPLCDRAPIVLRVCQSPTGWDALNDEDDVAKPDEKLHVYILAEKPGVIHISRRPRKDSGWFIIGKYHWLPEQPDDATMRDNRRWAKWCDDNKQRLLPEWAKEAKP